MIHAIAPARQRNLVPTRVAWQYFALDSRLAGNAYIAWGLRMMTPQFYEHAVLALNAVSLCTLVVLLFISAPYGRHARSGWGPTVPMRFAWIVMEAPTVIGFAIVYFSSSRAGLPVPMFLMLMFMLHYVERSFIYPFVMRWRGKRTPIFVSSLAFFFNCFNGPLNAYAITEMGSHLWTTSWFSDPRFIAGVALFLVGFVINRRADSILRGLRKESESGYRVPHGDLYRYISCPNYLGEIIEWCGFALACWTGAAAAFAFFTIANLLPRALSHHTWYRQNFENYPQERKAIIPFLL